MIAMALACGPKLIIADEPTTALDVTIQLQIMKLLSDLQKEFHMSIILITHDIGLVAELADRVIIMYAGQFMEEASVYDIFDHPAHPYTQALLESVPCIYDDPDKKLASIPGVVPEIYQDIEGCRFFERCPYTVPLCRHEQAYTEFRKGHFVRCHRAEKGDSYCKKTMTEILSLLLAAEKVLSGKRHAYRQKHTGNTCGGRCGS